jgi:hypothetical protein
MSAIQHVTQQGNNLRNDCAWACFKMLEQAYLGASHTLRQLAEMYGRVDEFTTIAQLYRGLTAAGVPSTYTTAATWEFYLQKWAEGVPVIPLLAMHVISDNDGYGWAHFAVTTGVKDGLVTIFNPLKLKGPTSIPEAEFRRAITERSKYVGGTNSPLQAVYPLAPLAAPVPTMFDRISTVAAEIHIAADALRKAG